jgi:hypothetical protein
MGTGSYTVKVCLANTLEFKSCIVRISYGKENLSKLFKGAIFIIIILSKENNVYNDGVRNNETNQFLSGMPYWFGMMRPTSFSSSIRPGVILPMDFSLKTIVTNFTRLNIDFGDYTYASIDISGI